jgi:hypothetical protein
MLRHTTTEFMTTAFSCQRRKCFVNILKISHTTHLKKPNHFHTLISTSSKIIQPINLTTAPTQTFAEIETLGSTCSKNKI